MKNSFLILGFLISLLISCPPPTPEPGPDEGGNGSGNETAKEFTVSFDANGGTFEINLKLKLSQVINRAGVMIKITHDVQTKFPKPKPAEFTMFLGPDGDLLLENPRQGNLPFKEVKTENPKPEVIPTFVRKTAIIVDKETGEIQS